MYKGNLVSNFLLEAEVGSFVVPSGDGGRGGIYALDTMHDPHQDPYFEIRDQDSGVLGLIMFGADDVELKLADVLLELVSGVDASGGEPIHGFLGSVDISKGLLEILFKGVKCSKRLVGESLLVVDFSPRGSRSFLHI